MSTFKIKINATTEEGFKRVSEVFKTLPKAIQDKIHSGEQAVVQNDYVMFRTENSYMGIFDNNYNVFFPKNTSTMEITHWHNLVDGKKEVGLKIEGTFIINKITITMSYYFKEGILPNIIQFI